MIYGNSLYYFHNSGRLRLSQNKEGKYKVGSFKILRFIKYVSEPKQRQKVEIYKNSSNFVIL